LASSRALEARRIARCQIKAWRGAAYTRVHARPDQSWLADDAELPALEDEILGNSRSRETPNSPRRAL